MRGREVEAATLSHSELLWGAGSGDLEGGWAPVWQWTRCTLGASDPTQG